MVLQMRMNTLVWQIDKFWPISPENTRPNGDLHDRSGAGAAREARPNGARWAAKATQAAAKPAARKVQGPKTAAKNRCEASIWTVASNVLNWNLTER